MRHKSIVSIFTVIIFLSSLIKTFAGQGEVIILFDQSGSINIYDSKYATKTLIADFVRANYLKYQISLVGFDEDNHFHFKIDPNSNINIDTVLNNIEEIKTQGLVTDFEKPFSYLKSQETPEFIRLALIISDGRPDIWDKKLDYLSQIIRADDRYSELNTLYKSMKVSQASPLMIYNKLFPLYFEKNLSFIDERISLLKKDLAGRIIIWDISGDSEYLKRWAKILSAQYISIPINKALIKDAVTEIQKKSDEILNQSQVSNQPAKTDISKDIVRAVPANNKKEDNSKTMFQSNFFLPILILVIITALNLFVLYRRLRQKGTETSKESQSTFSSAKISNDEQLLERLRADKPVSIFPKNVSEGSLIDNDVKIDAAVSNSLQVEVFEEKKTVDVSHENDYIKLQNEFKTLVKELEEEKSRTAQIDQLKENLKGSEEQRMFFEQEVISFKKHLDDITDKYNAAEADNLILKDKLASKEGVLSSNVDQVNPKQSTVELIDQLKKSLKESEDHRLSGEQEIERLKSEIISMNRAANDFQDKLSKLTEENTSFKEEITRSENYLIKAAAHDVSNKDKIVEITELKESLSESEQIRLTFEKEIIALNEKISVYKQIEIVHTDYENKLIEENKRLQSELNAFINFTPVTSETDGKQEAATELNIRVQRLVKRLRDLNIKETKYVDDIDVLTKENDRLKKHLQSAIDTVNLALSRIEQLKTEKAV